MSVSFPVNPVVDHLADLALWEAELAAVRVPSERTLRRVLADLDAEALDAAIGGYAADVTRGISPAPVLPTTAGQPNGSSAAARTVR